MVDKKNNNVQHKRITSREDKNYIRQRDLFAVANSVVVAEILAKVQCSDGNKYSIWNVQFSNADTFL